MRSADLLEARDDLGAFSRLVDAGLTDLQAESLRLDKRMTVLVAPRQTGKSRSLAVLGLHWAFRKANQRVLIVSGGDNSAKETLDKVRDIATTSPALAGSVVDEQTALVRLSNGSTIRSVPASERQIRSKSIDLLIIDEAVLVAAIDDGRLITQAALPTTMARPDARVVLASQPAGRSGYFYDRAMDGQRGSASIRTVRWRLADAPWVTAETLADMREQIPSPEQQRAELDGEFVDMDGGHRLIEREWIDAACARTLERTLADGLLAVDVARFGGDRTVAYSSFGGVLRRELEGRGWSTTRTVAEVSGVLRERLQSPPQPVTVVVDDTGVGGGVTDQARAAGLSVQAFIGAAASSQPQRFANKRAESFWRMRGAFERGEVDLDPVDRDLGDQLGDLVYGYDLRGRVQMESKDAMRSRGMRSPDHADAVAMAFAWARSGGHGVVALPSEPPRSPIDGRPLPTLLGSAAALARHIDGDVRRRGPRPDGWSAWGPRI